MIDEQAKRACYYNCILSNVYPNLALIFSSIQMARNDNHQDGFLSQLKSVRGEMRERFSRAHGWLQEREAALSTQLEEIEHKYRGRNARVDKQREELLATKEQIQSTMKGNENQKTLEAMLAPLDASLIELERGEERLERIGLEWDEELASKLRDVGKILLNAQISVVVPGYKNKGKPVLVACKHTFHSRFGGEFRTASSIAIEPRTENIYICDSGNHRIQVFNKSCEFLFSFNENIRKPFSIAIHDNRVYSTQYELHTLCTHTTAGEYFVSIGSMGNQKLQFNHPLGICIDSRRNFIYVCDGGNNRVQVLNLLDLTFHSFITGLSLPKDIKLFNRELFVLDRNNPCIHVYNGDHLLLRELISYGDARSQILKSYHFVIDQNSNFLFTDRVAGWVSIFTKEGDLIHTFGREGEGIGEFVKPKGIVVDSEGRIIIASSNPNHCIQFF